MELSQLDSFLREARLKGYAGGGEYAEESGEKVFKYVARGCLYEDRYRPLHTLESFAGEEVVYWAAQQVWYMIYSGGMVAPFGGDKALVKSAMRFLKENVLLPVLQKESDPIKEFWPRGPVIMVVPYGKDSRFSYRCYVEHNNIRGFRGLEVITLEEDLPSNRRADIFVHTFCGGVMLST